MYFLDAPFQRNSVAMSFFSTLNFKLATKLTQKRREFLDCSERFRRSAERFEKKSQIVL